MRTKNFTDKDLDLLHLLKQAGMNVINLGMEAYSNDDLKLFWKNAYIETSNRAYKKKFSMKF